MEKMHPPVIQNICTVFLMLLWISLLCDIAYFVRGYHLGDADIISNKFSHTG